MTFLIFAHALFAQAAGGQFAAYRLNRDICAYKMLIYYDTANKTERKRVLVHSDEVFVPLADRDGLFVGVDYDMPRTKNICDVTVSQQEASEEE